MRCGRQAELRPRTGPRGLLPVPALASRADKPRLPVHPEPWLQPGSRARACLRWTDQSEFLRKTMARKDGDWGSIMGQRTPRAWETRDTRCGRSAAGAVDRLHSVGDENGIIVPVKRCDLGSLSRASPTTSRTRSRISPSSARREVGSAHDCSIAQPVKIPPDTDAVKSRPRSRGI